jgi:hypothetical protein
VFGNGVAVGASGEQRLEDEKVEPTLREVYTGGWLAAHSVGNLLSIM